MIITFFGHSHFNQHEEHYEQIKRIILTNMKENEKTIFYCGGYGEFDQLCAKICCTIKSERKNCEIVYVTPYITESHQQKLKTLAKSSVYDTIIYPPLETVPLKFAISRRNKWMIDQADLIITYVEYSYGGAYKALKYAIRKKKNIINLAKHTF